MPLDREALRGPAVASGHAAGEQDAIAAQWFARRDAGLSAAQEREFQQWLQADPRHGEAFARLDSAWSTFGKPVRAGVADELLQELATRAARRRTGIAAAAVAGLLAVGVFWNFTRTIGPAASAPPTAVVLAPDRQVLPDGSVVELKDDAQITVDFSPAVRRVILRRGEAMFAVAKQPARPFVVSAGGIEVQAVGTAFSVQLGGGQIGVLVTEGRVALARTAETSTPGAAGVQAPSLPPPLATLDAGKHCVIETTPAARPQIVAVAAEELGERLAWRSPRLEFSGSPLGEAVTLLNRHANGPSAVRLELADASLAPMRVSGIFRADNTAAFVLLLEASFGVKAERSGNTITLRRAP